MPRYDVGRRHSDGWRREREPDAEQRLAAEHLQPAPAGHHVHMTLPEISKVYQAIGELRRCCSEPEFAAQGAVFVINLFENRLFTEGTHS